MFIYGSCMCVYECLCLCLYVYTCVYECLHVCMCLGVYECVFLYVYMCVCPCVISVFIFLFRETVDEIQKQIGKKIFESTLQ